MSIKQKSTLANIKSESKHITREHQKNVNISPI